MPLYSLLLMNSQLGFREVLAISNNIIIYINTTLYLPEFSGLKTII